MGTTTYGLDVAKSPEIASTWLKLTPKNKARAFSHSLGQERTLRTAWTRKPSALCARARGPWPRGVPKDTVTTSDC